jgi:hypothetical protein
MTGWQSIETAPKDETFVLLYFPPGMEPWQAEADGMVLGFWSEEYADWFHSEAAGNSLTARGAAQPTHWMPLPEPPTG